MTVHVAQAVAQVVFPVLMVLSVGLAQVPVLNLVMHAAISVLLTLGTMWAVVLPTWDCCCCCCCCEVVYRDMADNDDESAAALPPPPPLPHADATAAPTLPAAIPSPPSRLLYLDHLKAALTALVVLHHIVGAFVGGGSVGLAVGNFRSSFQALGVPIQILDQSWFMSCFFFISGYFTPSSFTRKGRREFLADKFTRLGVPFVLYFWIVGPTLSQFTDSVVGRLQIYSPSPGPTWFLVWLLIFNIAYAAINGGSAPDEGTPRRMALPGFARLCVIGAITGLAQGVQLVFAPSFVFMPISFGSLPFDVLFFTGGVLAASNGWLDALADARRSVEARLHLFTVFASIIVCIAVGGALYGSGIGGIFLSKNACGEAPDKGLTDTMGFLAIISIVIAVATAAGVYAMSVTYAALDYFRLFCATTSPFWRYASNNAYTVYLIHPVVVVPVTWSYIAIIRQTTGGLWGPWSDDNASASCLVPPGSTVTVSDDVLLFTGFAYTVVVSFLLVYPLASCVRRLPGLRRIL